MAGSRTRFSARFLEHRVPEIIPPCCRFGLWVRLENRGTTIWESNPANGNSILVTGKINNLVAVRAVLPHRVPPKTVVDLHLAVVAPARPGKCWLRLQVSYKAERVSKRRSASVLRIPITVSSCAEPAGAKLYEFALARNSWFYQPTSGVYCSHDGVGYPLLIARAKGCHVWDTEGRRFIDYTMGWGCALLGHAYEPVQMAVRNALASGNMLPLPHPLEMDVTRTLCEYIPCAEAVAFGKNGSDVCTLAVRLARAKTGRHTVLTCGYHGWQDWFVEALPFGDTGVPSRRKPLVFKFPFNDLEKFRKLLARTHDDLAAVILEPAGHDEDQVDCHYLKQLSKMTREAGAILIFDEIVTGFRCPKGSIQKATGVVPDLACFGKALANGMPLAALVGRREVFQAMPQVFYCPTFKGEMYSLAAASAALQTYQSCEVPEHICRFGTLLKTAVNAFCQQLDIPAKIIGPPFRCAMSFCGPDPYCNSVLRTLFLQELLKRGLVSYYGVFVPSYAHDNCILEETIAVIADSLRRVTESYLSGNLHRDLEIPLIERRY